MSIFDDLYAYENYDKANTTNLNSATPIIIPTAEDVRKARKQSILSYSGELMSKIRRGIDAISKDPSKDPKFYIDTISYSNDCIEEISNVLRSLGYKVEHKRGDDCRNGSWSQLTISL